jgi:hypothetical protein
VLALIGRCDDQSGSHPSLSITPVHQQEDSPFRCNFESDSNGSDTSTWPNQNHSVQSLSMDVGPITERHFLDQPHQLWNISECVCRTVDVFDVIIGRPPTAQQENTPFVGIRPHSRHGHSRLQHRITDRCWIMAVTHTGGCIFDLLEATADEWRA